MLCRQNSTKCSTLLQIPSLFSELDLSIKISVYICVSKMAVEQYYHTPSNTNSSSQIMSKQ